MRVGFAHRRSAFVVAVAFWVVFLASVPAALAESFDRMVIFGDSLSDPGNHYVAFGMTSRAPFRPCRTFPTASAATISAMARPGPSS
jgi:phospholipase/lecithinase/hemolysin